MSTRTPGLPAAHVLSSIDELFTLCTLLFTFAATADGLEPGSGIGTPGSAAPAVALVLALPWRDATTAEHHTRADIVPGERDDAVPLAALRPRRRRLVCSEALEPVHDLPPVRCARTVEEPRLPEAGNGDLGIVAAVVVVSARSL